MLSTTSCYGTYQNVKPGGWQIPYGGLGVDMLSTTSTCSPIGYVIDMPFSLIFDTVTLPFTVPITIYRKCVDEPIPGPSLNFPH